MKIDEPAVEAIARLAKLDFTAEEKKAFTQQFANIVKFVEQLSEVDTSDIEVLDIHDRGYNIMQPDAGIPGLSREAALANAPEHDEELFIVPKVIEES